MPRIVSVHSFRHGTGKSNLTANLAVSIARQGHHVGIIDTDVQLPGVHTLFGLNNETVDPILNYYLWGDCTLDDLEQADKPSLKIDQGEITVIGGGVYLAPSTVRVGEIPKLLRQGYDMNTLGQGFFDLSGRLNLDYLLLDTTPGLMEETLLAIALSDVLVLVLCLDAHSFQGVAVIVDVARKLGVPQILLVANQISSRFNVDEVRQQLTDTYGEPVAGVLPFLDEMVELASCDVFCLRYPEHPLTQHIQAIAQQIMDPTGSRLSREATTQTAKTPPRSEELGVELNMFDVLALPDLQRRIVNWILRQGMVTFSEIMAYTGQEEASLCLILGTLIEQGFIQELKTDDQQWYRPYMTVKQNRSIPQSVWQLLDNKTKAE